jgi:hypothetical protein
VIFLRAAIRVSGFLGFGIQRTRLYRHSASTAWAREFSNNDIAAGIRDQRGGMGVDVGILKEFISLLDQLTPELIGKFPMRFFINVIRLAWSFKVL